ncbi:hypothetical protein Tco_0046431 [Tanacetum coccineum]
MLIGRELQAFLKHRLVVVRNTAWCGNGVGGSCDVDLGRQCLVVQWLRVVGRGVGGSVLALLATFPESDERTIDRESRDAGNVVSTQSYCFRVPSLWVKTG